MNFDYHLMRFDWAGGPAGIGPGVARIARTIESVGIRTVSVMDHFFQMDAFAPAEDPMLEGYTALGYIAGVTERLRLRMLVGGVTYRYPGILAKIMTTLDVMSGGRAEFGIGAAWYEREHKGLGIPFPPMGQRFEMLEETLQIVLQMWSDNNGPYEGRHYQLAETLCSPQPVSSPRPRIMIGGSGEKKTLRMVAQYADGCNFMGGPDLCARKIAVLREHCDRLGRDISGIDITVLLRPEPDWTPDDVVRAAEAFAAVGVTTIVATTAGVDPVATVESLFGPAVERVRAIQPALL